MMAARPERPGLVRIAPFRAQDQDAARALILAGLTERWGVLDPTRNPDLNDIAATYADGVFLCAWSDAVLIGTGALVPRGSDTAEIVRMSVARDWRRHGVGRRLAEALLATAQERGVRRLILETTETWSDAIAFYRRLGFAVTHHRDGDVYFMLELSS